MPESIIQIKSEPGIKRDGTLLEGGNYVDGQWVRFQRGLPRKIGGYRSINKYLREISTQLSEFTQDNLTYVHSGSPNFVERFYIDSSGNTSIITNRTPASGFTANDNNMWQFTYDSDGVTNYILAQVAPNGGDITNSNGGEVFYGPLTGTTPLTTLAIPPDGNATGGIVALHPYTFMYGTNGYVAWSVPGDPLDFVGAGSGAANVTSQKIVRGLPLRGGPGNSPSGLFWSADSLVRASFVGGDTIFQFDTLSAESSILSSNSVIEYDGVFYWVGTDRFLSFNGVVREVPNTLNVNWFFDNLNYAQRQKVFVFKSTRFGEIWWAFPFGDATECTHLIGYNVRENTWYDTILPNNGRSAGLFPAVFGKVILTGVKPEATGVQTRVTEAGDTRVTEDDNTRITQESEALNYKLWIHGVGTDEIDGQSVQPVLSYFTTADICLPITSQENRAIQVVMIEPDFVQSGEMTVQVIGRANARAPEVYGEEKVIYADPSTPQEQVVYELGQRRQLRFKFTSNVLGGDFQMGTILAHVQKGDATVIG